TLGRGLDDCLIHADPSVVHQNVQSTETLHSLRNEREAGRLMADIGLHKQRFAATCRDLCRHTVTPRRIAVSKRHLSSLGDEAPHGGLPDTRRTTGYCGDHSIQLSHPPSLLLSCGEDTNAIRRGTGTSCTAWIRSNDKRRDAGSALATAKEVAGPARVVGRAGDIGP